MACDFCGINKERRTIAGNALCADCFELLQGLRNGEAQSIAYFSNPQNRELATPKALEYINDILINSDTQSGETWYFVKEQQKKDIEEKERQRAFQQKEESFIVTTTNTLEGFKITKYIGIQSGEVVLDTDDITYFYEDALEQFDISSEDYSSKLEDARTEAVNKLKRKCIKVGANAVIGVKTDIITIGEDMTVVTANGTAVIIEEISL